MALAYGCDEAWPSSFVRLLIRASCQWRGRQFLTILAYSHEESDRLGKRLARRPGSLGWRRRCCRARCWETPMTDRATPNLPTRDFAVTSAFYAGLGFVEGWRDGGWMIPRAAGSRSNFPFPDLDSLIFRSDVACGSTTSTLFTLRRRRPVCRRLAADSRGCSRRPSSIRECGSPIWSIPTGHYCGWSRISQSARINGQGVAGAHH